MSKTHPHARAGSGSPEKDPYRGLDHLGWAYLLVVALTVAGGALAHLSIEQIGFLGLGLACFLVAWMDWRYGIIGFSRTTMSGRPAETHVKRAPMPRAILAPLLVLVGIGFLLAGTRTGIGVTLAKPAHATTVTWAFVNAALNLVMSAVFVVAILWALVYGVVRRDGGVLFGAVVIVAIIVGVNYAFYALDQDAFKQAWESDWAPFRAMRDLLG